MAIQHDVGSDLLLAPWHRCLFGLACVLAGILLLCPANAVYGQCAVARLRADPNVCGTVTEEKLLPEDGYLARDSYTSRFFGFSLDLPITSVGHRITIPVMLERQHALLAIGFEGEKRFGRMTITAEESSPELDRYEDVQDEYCEDVVGYTPPPRRPIPGHVLRYGNFYANVHHTGKTYVHHFWLRMKNYIIRVAVDSNDPNFLKSSKQALVEAEYYCARDGQLTSEGKIITPKGEPYQGPTVPTWWVDEAIKNQPGHAIPAGKVSQGVYDNPDLGLRVELPVGWEVVDTETSSDPPRDARGLREQELLHACSRALLRAAQMSDSGQPGPMPAIALQAFEPRCVSPRMPAYVKDGRSADEMVAALDFFSEFGDVRSGTVASFSNRPFLVFHGVIGWRGSEDTLARRMSETLFATEHHNLLLLWSLTAPTAADLDVMPATKVTFDDGQPILLPPIRATH